MKYIYLSIFGLLIGFTANSQTSVQNGNWMSPLTWDCTCIPDPYSSSIDLTVNHAVTADLPVGTYFTGGSLTIGANGSLIQTGNGDLYMDNATTIVNGTLDMRRIAIDKGTATYNGIIQNCDSLWNDSSTVINNGIIEVYDHQVYGIGIMTNNGTITVTNNMNIMGEYTNSVSGTINVAFDFSNANLLGGRASYTNNGNHVTAQDFLNATNDTILGTGTFCIGNASSNLGTVLGTVEFKTPTGAFTLNTGFVAPSVSFVSGACSYVGINETSDENLLIYPNPFTNVINFEGIDNISSIMVLDLNGKTVYSNSQNTKSIDLGSLESGTYFLKITDSRGAVLVEKVVK